MGLSKSSIVESLQATYGESVTAADIRAWCAMNDLTIRRSQQTVRLQAWVVVSGTWTFKKT